MRALVLAAAFAVHLLTAAPAALAASPPPPREAPPAARAEPLLVRPDLEAWLDGFMPFALQRGDIAGAEVVVVKDGQVLLAKGYGLADVATLRPVDPQATLMRPGSISKLFTWTAVMQLVEAGKLDLDSDVNRYLDFTIPPRAGKPITLRDLMIHRPGFEEKFKVLEAVSRRDTPSLEAFVKGWTPTRIYPPGEVSAYSNYGATLAGYIVQRVSGQRFEDYVRDHIFVPLEMRNATFEQDPHPGDGRATNYVTGSGKPHAFEFVGDAPAGALSISGADMAKFMLAHLGEGQWDGRRILSAQSERQMQTPSWPVAPPFNAMALGFYGQDWNGHRILGHAGDLIASHADLRLMPNDHVGVYVAMNSWGKDNASSALRDALMRGFFDRYFAAPPAPPLTWRNSRADGARLVGSYEPSRRSDDTFASLGGILTQVEMRLRPDGALIFPSFLEPNGQPSLWRETASGQWRNADGTAALAINERGGRVLSLTSSEIPPIMVWTPVPASRDAAWNRPLLFAALIVQLAICAAWAVVPLVRRAYGGRFELSGRAAVVYRLSRGAALLDFVFLAGWLAVLAPASSNPAILGPALDPWLRAIQATGVAGLLLGVCIPLNLVRVWRERPRRWAGRCANLLLTLSWLATAWLALIFHLITPSLNY
jgi:CubicO group peptidase (beta-lactamase class C family)